MREIKNVTLAALALYVGLGLDSPRPNEQEAWPRLQSSEQIPLNCFPNMEPSFEACSNLRSSELAHLSLLRQMISSSNISDSNKQYIQDAIRIAEKAAVEGRMRWYEWSRPEEEGGQVVFPDLSWADPQYHHFVAKIVVPVDYKLTADNLGNAFHETLHGVKAYQRFSDKQPLVSDYNQEEMFILYYQSLITVVAEQNGYFNKWRETDWKLWGIDTAGVVSWLDQHQFGPKDAIWRYIYDMTIMYRLDAKYMSEEREFTESIQGTEKLEQHMETKRGIEELRSRWQGFPEPRSPEAVAINDIERLQLVSNTFFNIH